MTVVAQKKMPTLKVSAAELTGVATSFAVGIGSGFFARLYMN